MPISMHFTQQGAGRRVNEYHICMNFMFRNGWHISFLEADCRTSLPLKLTFADADKICEMYVQVDAGMISSKDDEMLSSVIASGAGVLITLFTAFGPGV